MTAFRICLAIIIACRGAYPVMVGSNHGWHLLPAILGDMVATTRPGQFNCDFHT